MPDSAGCFALDPPPRFGITGCDPRALVLARDKDTNNLCLYYRDFRRGHALGQIAHARPLLESRPVSLQEARGQLRQVGRRAGAVGIDRPGDLLEVPAKHRCGIRGVERKCSGEHLLQQHTKRVEVRAAVNLRSPLSFVRARGFSQQICLPCFTSAST